MTWRDHGRHRVWLGDCLDMLRALPDTSVDAVFTDPPYPSASREYGRWTGPEWLDLVRAVLIESRRVCKPSGSIVLVYKPPSLRVGRMLPESYALMHEIASGALLPGWGIVQDAYWWNHATPPTVHCQRRHGLTRPSMAWMVWAGSEDCYRAQDRVLWEAAASTKALDTEDRALRRFPSGQTMRAGRVAATVAERGGSTPFNLLPIGNANSSSSAGASGHGAGTPAPLVSWWLRYVVPPGGTVVDPFLGSGTTMLEAERLGLTCIGAERFPKYHDVIAARWERESGHEQPSLWGAA